MAWARPFNFLNPLVRPATFGGDGRWIPGVHSVGDAGAERELHHRRRRPGDHLARVTNAAVDLIDGIGYADLMLAQDGEFLSVAPTDPFVADLDALQMQLEKGRARRQRSMTRVFWQRPSAG